MKRGEADPGASLGLLQSAMARDHFHNADTADMARLVEEAGDAGHRIAAITKTTVQSGTVTIEVKFKE